MNKLNKPIILILSLTFIFLTNCQGVRDNLSLKKKENSDEFLVQKKNPLVLPPNYESLPTPSKKKEVIIYTTEFDKLSHNLIIIVHVICSLAFPPLQAFLDPKRHRTEV